MFERFTQEARQVVVRARAAAVELRHPLIGTEHLLLALMDDAGPVGTMLTQVTGRDAGWLRAEIERRVPRRSPSSTRTTRRRCAASGSTRTPC